MGLYNVVYIFLIHLTTIFSKVHEVKTIFIIALRHALAFFTMLIFALMVKTLLGKTTEALTQIKAGAQTKL